MSKKVIIGLLAFILICTVFIAFKRDSTTSPEKQADITNKQPSISPTQVVSNTEKQTVTLESLPKAPSGYIWHECKNLRSFFLKPTGWYTLDETKEDTQACFITKEEIIGNSMFQTGVSINAVPNVSEKTGSNPSSYAETLFNNAKNKMNVQNYKVTNQGPLKVYSATLYPAKIGNNEPIVIYQMIAANDTTGSIFIITFESPESKWSSFMPIVQIMTQNMALNGNF